jgi:hypothetical protein
MLTATQVLPAAQRAQEHRANGPDWMEDLLRIRPADPGERGGRLADPGGMVRTDSYGAGYKGVNVKHLSSTT